MIITRHLPQPCPNCGQVGEYGNISVAGDALNRGCNACGNWERIPLPEVCKKIIYLDQFFLSHAFREGQEAFVDAALRIKTIAHKQLIVCPWSTVHHFETHLWTHSSQAGLWKFIKQTARGHQYSNSHHIKSMQIQRAFESFINNEDAPLINGRDALRSDIHQWDDYFWIDVGSFIEDANRIRSGKERAIASLVDLFDEWAISKSTFEQDVIKEANGYADSLIQLYTQSVQVLMQGTLLEYLSGPADSSLIEVLMHRDNETLNDEKRVKRLRSFLYSESFRRIPFVDISCRLFAVLRKRVREGQFANRNKAKSKLSGLFYDVDAISIYGPYSDAIFIDRAMHQWLAQEEAQIIENYSFNIFSVDNWGEFHSYLDEIERKCPQEVNMFLPIVYPGSE